MPIRRIFGEHDPFPRHGPARPGAGPQMLQYAGLRPATYRYAADFRLGIPRLRVVDITIRRFQCGKPAVRGELYLTAPIDRHFPHLPVSGLIGGEVNPLSVAGKTRHQALHDRLRLLGSVYFDNEDSRLPIVGSVKGNAASIRRPARSPGTFRETNLSWIRAVRVAYPDLPGTGTVRHVRDPLAIG